MLDDPARIHNIDETWYSQQEEKRTILVVSSDQKIPYRIYEGRQDHITFAMCASAAGNWLPTMFLYKGSLPRTEDYHSEGPSNALYKATESGHIDADSYLEYIKHLDKYLCPWRPLVIFQDNHRCHEDFRLIEYCIQNKIHLYNLPPKSSHLMQPLDKLFGPLKANIEKKKQEALLVNRGHITKSKVPISVRFAIDSMKKTSVINAFLTTGIFPLNSSAIDPSLLVGNPHVNCTEEMRVSQNVPFLYSERIINSVSLEVYDEDNQPIPQQGQCARSVGVQTNPVESLPCSVCINNDLSVHPAVRAGTVPLELAAAFLDTPPDSANRQTKQRRAGPKVAKGRAITHGSRLDEIKEKQRIEREKEELK